MGPLLRPLALAAAHDLPILLTGESGTGKTFLARVLHECGPRTGERFLTVTTAALAAGLIDSELFGHVRGAFTGATEHKEGKFAAAGRGTLLLDDIDALGLEPQAKLLRVVETGEFEPVGSNATRRCQARIIAATNCDLEGAVEAGRFRHDLYYRLNVLAFHLPPLRERVGDIAPLVHNMVLGRFNARFHKDLDGIHPATLRLLEAHPWPGNVRQLENVLQQAVLASAGPELLPTHLPAVVRDHAGVRRPAAPGGRQPVRQPTPEAERELIVRTLGRYDARRARAARALGISRVTLYRKMKKYGLTDR
jgi:DNA-binding NtrC family response regulator